MGIRFFRRIRFAPGVTLNFSKSGLSTSFGPRGAKFTIGSHGTRSTVGIPGTGLYYTKYSSAGTKKSKRTSQYNRSRMQQTGVPSELDAEQKLTLSFFQRLITPPEEQEFVAGSREYVLGSKKKALEHFKKASHLADAAFVAGFLSLKNRQWLDAEKYLYLACADSKKLGKYFAKYGISLSLSLAITDELVVYLTPSLKDAQLGLVEAYQHQEKYHQAIEVLKKLRRSMPEDLLIKLSLVELLYHVKSDDKKLAKQILQIIGEIQNDSPIHTALMLYHARALKTLGLLQAAKEVLSSALRKKKDRDNHLLLALRYERALVYQALGQSKRAKTELEKIYAESPDYQDVSKLLDIKQ